MVRLLGRNIGCSALSFRQSSGKGVMETTMEMIARLREEKKLLLAAILKIEDWAFGEGYFLTPSMKARFEIVRRLDGNINDGVDLALLTTHEQLRVPKKRNVSPEKRAAAAERMRQWHAKRKQSDG